MRKSSGTPEPIFWTPGLAAQMTPTTGVDGGDAFTAGKGLDSFASAAAAESQHHTLSSQLNTLQAATQKGANRCPSACTPALASPSMAHCLYAAMIRNLLGGFACPHHPLGSGTWAGMGDKASHLT